MVPREWRNATGVVSRAGASMSAFQGGQGERRRGLWWEVSTIVSQDRRLFHHTCGLGYLAR